MRINVGRTKFLNEEGEPLDFDPAAPLDWGATGLKEIIQNIWIILLTPILSVHLDRTLGMDYLFIDLPVNEAPDAFVIECLQKVQGFEPRCKILDVSWQEDALQGHLIPLIKVRLDNVTYRDRIPYSSLPTFEWPA